MATTLVFNVVAHDGASASLAGIGRSVDNNSSKWRKMGSVVRAAGKIAATGILAAAVAGGAMAKSAADDQVAVKQLSVAMVNNAGASDSQQAAVERWISAVGVARGVADDDLRPALTRLVTATHDVSKAQDLARLGMDVAAGTGKDLTTVTTALAKAQNGSITGLSRLGIATKDAAGKTLDFDTLQVRLAKTFKGQAATAADTASGQYARLKVMLSEAGEAIGYKLLPYATRLGDWLINEGVPYAQRFGRYLGNELGPVVRDLGGWLRDNKDDLADFGRQIVQTVVPAVKSLADIVGKAVGFFMALPDPVRRFGIEAAVAAAVVPKLSGAMSAMGLPSFGSNLDKTSTKMERLGGAAKMAGGAAGMALLYDSTRQTSKAMGALEGAAGGALAGFAVGGPLGAGLGALAGLELALVTSTDKVKESFKFVSPKAGEYADQLDRVSGAATSATRHTAALALQQSGAIEAGQALGLTSRDLVKYVLGNEAAVKRVTAAIDSAAGETITWTDSMGRTKTILAGSSADAIKLNTALNRNAEAFGKSKQEAQELALASGDLSKKLKDVKDHAQIVSSIEEKGYPEHKRELAEILAGHDLARKDVKTVIKALGVDATVGQVQRIIDHLALVKSKTVTLTVKTNNIGGTTSSAGGHSSDPLDPRKGNGGNLTGAGHDLIMSLVAGLEKGKVPAQRVLDAVTAAFQNRVEHWRDLVEQSKSFADSFKGWATSVFSMQGEEGAPLTLAQMLAQAHGEEAKSGQAEADIKRLIKMGLSEDLIEQLQAQGAQGLEALHTLAAGSQADIDELNRANAATQANYAAAGIAAANVVYAADIAQAAAAKDVAAALLDVIQGFKNLEKVEFKVRGNDLIAIIEKDKKDRGK